MIVAIKRLGIVFLCLGILIAFITTVMVAGFFFRIIAFLLAVLCVLAFIVFLVWAAIKEFVIDPLKKPPE